MHRDKKLGLALGVLLVGIVAAMFFRLDPAKRHSLPRLNSSRALDDEIAELPLAPYPDDESWGEEDGDEPANKLIEPPLWEMPEFLADDLDEKSEDWLAQTPAAPDPIPSVDDDRELLDGDMFDETPDPRDHQAWTVSDSKTRTAQPAQSQSVRIHRVRSGDTLSGIAAYYLGSSARFNEIYVLNRDVMPNPNTLTVGTELRIPQANEAKRPVKSNESVFRNADGQDVLEPGQSNEGPTFPASPSSLRNSARGIQNPPPNGTSGRRFVPARRLPFSPRNGNNANQGAGNQPADKNLSQVPPPDLPEVE